MYGSCPEGECGCPKTSPSVPCCGVDHHSDHPIMLYDNVVRTQVLNHILVLCRFSHCNSAVWQVQVKMTIRNGTATLYWAPCSKNGYCSIRLAGHQVFWLSIPGLECLQTERSRKSEISMPDVFWSMPWYHQRLCQLKFILKICTCMWTKLCVISRAF